MLDFGALPPEINSARMYSGPGSGPLTAAAAAWEELAAQLESYAAGYSATLAELRGPAWSGDAAAAMAAAVEPYVVWATGTAARAGQAAAQARAAAAAHEAAFAATVPPHVVAANRIQLATLIATNFFGQNAPAMAATESCYAEMWAQDATAMYGYAAASSAATTLTPFTHPPRTTAAHGQAAQAAAVSHAADSQPPGWPSLVNSVSGFNTVVTTPGQSFFAAARTLLGWGQFGTGLNLANIQAAKAAAGAVRLPAAVAGPSVSGGLGRAATVGRLSVPPAWPAANPVAPLGETVIRQPGGMVRLVSASAPDSPAGPGIPPALRTADRSAGVPVLRNGRRAFRMPRPAYGG